MIRIIIDVETDEDKNAVIAALNYAKSVGALETYDYFQNVQIEYESQYDFQLV